MIESVSEVLGMVYNFLLLLGLLPLIQGAAIILIVVGVAGQFMNRQ